MLHLNSIESMQSGSSSRRVSKSHRRPGGHFPGVFLNPVDASAGTMRVHITFAEQLYDVLIRNILKSQCIFWYLYVNICLGCVRNHFGQHRKECTKIYNSKSDLLRNVANLVRKNINNFNVPITLYELINEASCIEPPQQAFTLPGMKTTHQPDTSPTHNPDPWTPPTYKTRP